MSRDLSTEMKVALEAAEMAARIIKSAIDAKSNNPVNFEEKSSSSDLVTAFDKQCEAEVVAVLKNRTPTYAIISEETRSTVALTNAPTWVVDPIDGTTSFIHGMYDCAVSIGLVVDGVPVVGVVNAPLLGKVFTAVKGEGAFCNGTPIKVSSTKSLRSAIIFSHFSSCNRSEEAVNSIISIQKALCMEPVHAIRCHGSAAVDMCLVASGAAEVYFDAETHIWDIAAGTVILTEAGGVVHDVDNADHLNLCSRGVCCGNSTCLTTPIVSLINKYHYAKIVL